jgi:hypothetical protein
MMQVPALLAMKVPSPLRVTVQLAAVLEDHAPRREMR